MIKILFGLSRN